LLLAPATATETSNGKRPRPDEHGHHESPYRSIDFRGRRRRQ